MLQHFFTSAFALRLGLWLGRIIPGWLGYALADIATWFVAHGRSALVRTVQANMRVVLGEWASEQDIAALVRAVFRNAGRAYFDFYRGVAKGRDSVLDSVIFTARAERYLSDLQQSGGATLVVHGHLSNFDLAGLAFSARGIPTQGLTFRTPPSGYDLQNQIRRSWGIDITPVSVAALRQALRRLRTGGLVVTGADRPDPDGTGEFLDFFGRPAFLPSGYIRLALQAGVPVAVAHVRNHPMCAHAYVVDVDPPFRLEMIGDRANTVRHYAQIVLNAIEADIRAHPDQWLMFYPVWTDEIPQMRRDNDRAIISGLEPEPVVIPTGISRPVAMFFFSNDTPCPAPN